MRRIEPERYWMYAAVSIVLIVVLSTISDLVGFSDWLLRTRCGQSPIAHVNAEEAILQYLRCQSTLGTQRMAGIFVIALVGATLLVPRRKREQNDAVGGP